MLFVLLYIGCVVDFIFYNLKVGSYLNISLDNLNTPNRENKIYTEYWKLKYYYQIKTFIRIKFLKSEGIIYNE